MGLSSDCYPSQQSNFPDVVHTKLMEEQRSECMKHLEELATTPEHCETVKDCSMLSTMWCDSNRTNDLAQGGTGCFGAGITDVRVESRRYKKDSSGSKIPGSETQWSLCQILQVGSNLDDPRSVINAEHFRLVTADDDGSNKKLRSLKDITANAKALFPSEGMEKPKLEVDKVAVAHRMAFVPIPSAESGWACEVRYVCLGFNTVTEEHPAHAILFGDTMNTSLFEEEPGRLGFQPLYTKLTSSINPATGYGGSESKHGCYATSVEATNRTIKNIGTESAEESAAAAARGKGTQVRTGPISLVGTSSAAWHVAIALDKPDSDSGGGFAGSAEGAVFRSLGADEDEEEPHYRGLPEGEDDDDGFEAVYMTRGGKPIHVDANEGRIGLGSLICEAKKLPEKNPVAQKRPAIATSVAIMTVPMGCVPSKETIQAACAELKKRHAQTTVLGTEVASRMSAEAVEAGLTTEGPLSESVVEEIEATTGTHQIEKVAPYSKRAKTAMISQGRPLISGVPME